MKSILLLATGLFLISAPAPDADDIAEMTANFIVPTHVAGTLASDEQIERGDVVIYPVQSGETMAALQLSGAERSGIENLPAG